MRGSIAGSAGKPSPPKILGAYPKPDAGVLLQIILRVPPDCGVWAAVVVVVEVGAVAVAVVVWVTVAV